MVFDLIGWSEALPGVAQQFVAAGLIDNFMVAEATANGIMLLPRHNFLLGVYAAAVGTMEEARFIQADLKLDHQFYKCGLIADGDPLYGYTDLFDTPLPVKESTALFAASVNAVSEDTLIGAWVGDKPILDADTSGRADYIIHGVSDQLLVANTWTQCVVVWDQNPPQGRYAITGMRGGVFGAAALNSTLMRLVIPGSGNAYRPGVPCTYMGADHEEYQGVGHEPWAKWPLYREVSFMDTQMPNIECLSPGANTDENVELKIVRIGNT